MYYLSKWIIPNTNSYNKSKSIYKLSNPLFQVFWHSQSIENYNTEIYSMNSLLKWFKFIQIWLFPLLNDIIDICYINKEVHLFFTKLDVTVPTGLSWRY